MSSRGLTVTAAALCLSACLSARTTAYAQEVERIVWPGDNMNLEGTKRGPHYVMMSKKEREDYRRWATTNPEGKRRFSEIMRKADATVVGEANNRKALLLAYVVRRDKKYFEAWRLRWLTLSNRLNTLYPTAMDMAKAYGPRNRFIWGNVDDGLPFDYDIMADSLSNKEEELFRWQIKKYCDALRIWKVDRKNVKGQGETVNMAAMTIGNTSPLWFAIGYDDCIEWSISHEPGGGRDSGGMLQWLRVVRDNRVWGEALAYQWYVSSGLQVIAECAWRYDGRDAWNMTVENGVKPRNIVDGMVDMAYPMERTGIGLGSIRIANFGEEATSLFKDQWLNYGGGSRHAWMDRLRSVSRLSKGPGYSWLASVNKGVGDERYDIPTEEPLIRFPEGQFSPPPAPCSVFPNAGIAMLRADESPGYWMGRGLAMQVMGGEKRRSAPGDSFSIRLHGAGRLLYPDWAMVTYEVYDKGGWERAGVRRNSAMIDGRETSSHLTNWRHAFWPEVKYLALRASRYGHDRSERAFMMTREYLLDIFDMVVCDQAVEEMNFDGYPQRPQYRGWSGAGLWDENGRMPNSHTFDYVMHGIGRQALPPDKAFVASREFTTESWPNRWFNNERRCDMGGDAFEVDWIQKSGGMEMGVGVYGTLGREWFEDRAAVRMHMLGAPGTVVYSLEAPMGAHHAESRPPPHWPPPVPTNVVDHHEHPEMTIKTLVVRRNGKEAQFAVVHEAYGERPAISRVDYLHQPGRDDAVRAVGVKVTAPGYVDRLYMTLGQPAYTRHDGVQHKQTSPDAKAPEVTITSRYDANEMVRFAGQAYMRMQGDRLIVRGDMRAFRVHASGVRTVIVNGKEPKVRRSGEYVLLGDATAPASLAPPVAPPATIPATPRVAVDIPQRYVNLDAQEGGWMVVRVVNWGDKVVSGRVTVKLGAGLTTPSARTFKGLGREQQISLGFELKPDGAEAGKLVPVEVAVTCNTTGARSVALPPVTVEAAVGVTVAEAPAAYSIPMYDYSKGMPGRPKPDKELVRKSFDYIQVRAPGYTIRIDKRSGLSRWIADPMGVVRTSMGWFPYSLNRDEKSAGSYQRVVREEFQILNAPGLDWFKKADYKGQGSDPEGNPTLTFTSEDGGQTHTYALTPAAVTGKDISVPSFDVPAPMKQSGLGFEIPVEPWWREDAVSVWPDYPLPTRPPPAREPALPRAAPNLLAGMKPILKLPPAVEATGGVYLDEELTVDGMPSICIDLDKLRGIGHRKYEFRWRWPITAHKGRRYRYSFKMRHENVAKLTDHEPVYVRLQPLYGKTYSGLWQSVEAGMAQYWPRRVREWTRVHDAVVSASSTMPLMGNINAPGDPEQTGKIWVGGFIVEQVE